MDLSTRKVRVIFMFLVLNVSIKEIQTFQSDIALLPWNHWCKIFEETKTAICSAHGKKLTEIPNLPQFVQKLHLDSDRFHVIKTQTFEPIRKNNISLKVLSVKSSQVQRIGDEAFKNLPSLQSLDLSSNWNLNISTLKHSFRSIKSQNLTSLSFTQMKWTSENVSLPLFIDLSSKSIDFVDLANNKFSYIPTSLLEGLQTLKRIDLSYNELEKCDNVLSRLKNLKVISLSNNHITKCNVEYLPKTLKKLQLKNNGIRKVPNFCSSSKDPFLPELEILMLERNLISNMTKASFDCIPSLKHLDLSLNNIRHLRSWVFSSLLNLKVLNLRRMKQSVKHVDEGALSIPSLRKLYFDRNYYHFNIKRVSLSNCSKLEYLDLSYNYMPKWSQGTRFVLNGLTSLRIIQLTQVYWNVLPNDLFKMIPNVREVDLSWNKITLLNSSLFPNESKIFRMKLDSNRIAHVGPNTFPDVFLKSIKIMDLSGNPFACDCNLLWFRDLLVRKSGKLNITFKQYPHDYTCLSPPGRKGLKLANFTMTPEDCQQKSNLVFIIVASSGSVVVFGLLLTFTLYKIRWHVRYWIYLMRYKKNGYSRILDQEFKFDGFIIYSDDDSDFVHDILLTKLEMENGCKMCVHVRDFEIGKTIVDNIVECMSQSRHALIVMSKKFCQSKWCKFEMLLAQDRWLRNEGDPLVIVMLEEVDSRHMNKALRALIQTTTYCSWTENEVGQELFWEQLFRSLKKYAE